VRFRFSPLPFAIEVTFNDTSYLYHPCRRGGSEKREEPIFIFLSVVRVYFNEYGITIW